MRRALELAALGRGHVEPNPMVGCVLVRDGQIVGEGWHRRYGSDHAEIEAIRRAGPTALGATCYVTLEPCSHYGKTPPCTDALIAAGVETVVAAMEDPHPNVAGCGFAELKKKGIKVEVGLCADAARFLNAPYLCRIEKNRPWITAKWALTLDGKFASRSNSSQWISNALSLAHVHDLRSRMDAILIGIRTAESDDPMLSVRTATPGGSHMPLRIVLDSHARLPLASRLVRTARELPLLVAVGSPVKNTKLRTEILKSYFLLLKRYDLMF